MGRRQDTQPTASGYGQPSRGGLSVGAIQAASPLGFWWLDPATFTILKYRFSSRRRRSSCSCGPSSASVISPDLEHGERLILGARTGGDRSHEPATLRELMDRMGHSSTRAAMIHIHGNDARQHEIADTLSQLARQELDPVLKAAPARPEGKRSGTQRVRKGRRASRGSCQGLSVLGLTCVFGWA
jgi:hypothetical protein